MFMSCFTSVWIIVHRVSIHPTSQAFWDRLCEHFVYLLRYKAMTAEKIAEIFAPHLISEDSPYSNGVIKCSTVAKLL